MTETPETERTPGRQGADHATSEPTAPDLADVENPVASQRDDAGLSLEAVFGILRNERRQHVLSYILLADGDAVELGDLAEHIAAIENDKPIQALDSQERKRVYVALYQCHLPKMADANVIAFDKDRGVVEPGPNIGQLETYLDVPTDDDPNDTPVHYLVLATAGSLAYLLAAVLDPGGAVAGGAILGLGFLAFIVLASRARTR